MIVRRLQQSWAVVAGKRVWSREREQNGSLVSKIKDQGGERPLVRGVKERGGEGRRAGKAGGEQRCE